MCDRYAFSYNKQKLEEVYPNLKINTSIKQDFNIAPTNEAPVIYKKDSLHMENMIWGLIPFWKKYGDNNGTLFNARVENISSSVSFRLPLRSKRCVIPAQSIYYWIYQNKKKIPFRVYSKNLEDLFIAGVYDIWKNQQREIKSFSIITCPLEGEKDFYSRRIPLCLSKEEANAWVEEIDLNSILKILNRPPSHEFISYQITDAINDLTNKSKSIQKEVNNEQLLF